MKCANGVGYMSYQLRIGFDSVGMQPSTVPSGAFWRKSLYPLYYPVQADVQMLIASDGELLIMSIG